MRFRFLPVSMKRSRRKGREQGGRGVVKIMARDVQNFQSIKEKYVKKVDSRPEQSALALGCSQLGVWTPAGAKMDINMNKVVN